MDTEEQPLENALTQAENNWQEQLRLETTLFFWRLPLSILMPFVVITPPSNATLKIVLWGIMLLSLPGLSIATNWATKLKRNVQRDHDALDELDTQILSGQHILRLADPIKRKLAQAKRTLPTLQKGGISAAVVTVLLVVFLMAEPSFLGGLERDELLMASSISLALTIVSLVFMAHLVLLKKHTQRYIQYLESALNRIEAASSPDRI